MITESTLISAKSARLIRLLKSADGYIKDEGSATKKKDGLEELSFYTFGFFNRLTYIKPTEEKLFSYKHCFGIEYPYRDETTNAAADQLFCIYEGTGIDTSFDPFEAVSEEMPFLGVILISVNTLDAENFRNFLDTTIETLKNDVLNTRNLKIYKTLNCADICIAQRTDSLSEIYSSVNRMKKYFNDKKIQSNISVIQCMVMDSKSTVFKPELIAKNKNVYFDLRLVDRAKYSNYATYGILGLGGTTMRIGFEDYFRKVYPRFIRQKQGHSKNSIVHERIIYDDSDSFNESCSALGESCDAENYIKELKNTVKKIEKNFFNLLKRDQSILHCKYKFVENITLINELISVFSDLWYQYTPINGYIFYVQVSLMLHGIENNIKCFSQIKQVYNQDDLCEMLIDNMHKSIVCIDYYNEMLQVLNLDSVNYPTHELQSKVNTEKYLLAYTAYLHTICAEFYKQYDNENSNNNDNRRRILPIAMFDINAERISAFTLFDRTEFSSNNNETMKISLYSVVFPNYRRFANIRHILPVLTHELSHEFRYMNKKERNKQLIQYMLEALSKEIVKGLLHEADIDVFTINSLTNSLTEKINKSLCNILFSDADDLRSTHIYEISEKLIQHLDTHIFSFINERHEYLSNIELKLKPNHEIFCTHIQKLCQWLLHMKKRVFGENAEKCISNDNEKLYGCFIKLLKNQHKRVKEVCGCSGEEDYIKILLAGQSINDLFEFTNEQLNIICSRLLSDCNNTLKIVYEKTYTEYLSYISEQQSRKYEEIPFETNVFLFNSINDFYVKHKNKKDEKDLVEFCQMVIDINSHFNVLWATYLIKKPQYSKVEKNLEKIFQDINVFVNSIDKNSSEHIFIRSANSRNIFTTLGLYNSDSTVFLNILKRVLLNIKPKLDELFDDRLKCYEEICADLGMCAAFRMTAFGYLKFLAHIFSQESNIAWDYGKAFTVDRVRAVILVLLSEEVKEFPDEEKPLEFNRAKYKLIKNIIKRKNDTDMNPDEEYYDDVRININVVNKFVEYLNIEDLLYSDLLKQPIAKHYFELYNEYILESEWVKNCNKDSTVQAIGKHYNETDIKEEKKSHDNFFEHQIKFVYDYYCQHRDLYNNLMREISENRERVLSVEDCIEALYRKEDKN